MYAEESVELLKNSGIQFDRHDREGIETVHFAEMLIVSGTNKTVRSSRSASEVSLQSLLVYSQNIPLKLTL